MVFMGIMLTCMALSFSNIVTAMMPPDQLISIGKIIRVGLAVLFVSMGLVGLLLVE